MPEAIKLDKSAYLSPGEKMRQAVTRLTRTPITYEHLADKSSLGGDYAPNLTMMNLLRSSQPLQDIKDAGSIRMYLDSPTVTNIPNTTHHEEIHSLLNSIGDPTFKEAQDYGTAQSFVQKNRNGNPDFEVPAYMGAFDPNELPGMDPSLRNRLVQAFTQKLQQIKPQAAEIFSRLSQGVQR